MEAKATRSQNESFVRFFFRYQRMAIEATMENTEKNTFALGILMPNAIPGFSMYVTRRISSTSFVDVP